MQFLDLNTNAKLKKYFTLRKVLLREISDLILYKSVKISEICVKIFAKILDFSQKTSSNF